MMNYDIPADNQIKGLNKIYLKYFGYKNNGLFIDVGAYDGVTFSNTWGLACAGWSGICYEPVPDYYQICYNNHMGHNVVTVQTCIGDKEGEVELSVAGTLSTINNDYLNSEYWHNDYRHAQKTISKITTLDKSLKYYNVKPEFDVLSLDVEGAETDVLKAFDINYWKPKMAIVEAQELHEAKELTLQAPFINKYFDKAGYIKIYSDEINNIYIRKD